MMDKHMWHARVPHTIELRSNKYVDSQQTAGYGVVLLNLGKSTLTLLQLYNQIQFFDTGCCTKDLKTM
jgi:hypothetical protein